MAPSDGDTATRSYIRSDRAWYASGNELGPGYPNAAEVILSQGTQQDYEAGERVPQIEIVVAWHDWGHKATFDAPTRYPGSRHKWSASVCIFDESWQALTLWRDLWDELARLADEGGGMAHFHIDPDDFETLVQRLGFVDRTPTVAS